MSTLFELTQKSLQLANQLALLEGELTPELETELDLMEGDFARKVDSYCGVIQRLEAEVEFWQKRKAESESILRRLECSVSLLKGRLKETAQALSKPTLQGLQTKATVFASKGKLVLDEDKIPQKYTKIVQYQEPDKERIREALENGEVIPGAEIKPGLSLRISLGKQIT